MPKKKIDWKQLQKESIALVRGKFWKEEELAIIREAAKHEVSAKIIYKEGLLPGRSANAIRERIGMLRNG